MNIDQILDLILGASPLLIFKICLLLLLLFYVLFAWVVYRQERFMSGVVEVSISPFLRLLAIVHFWAAVGLFIFALFVL